jgi:small subunit ribosomal protein S3
MGQKVNPIGLRLGIINTWDSRWYSRKEYAKNLHEDIAIRTYIKKRLRNGEVSKVEIIRYPEKINVIIHTARPGIVIGRKGAEVEAISKELAKFTDKDIQIKIKEVKNPVLDAELVAQSIARQLEGRVAFRRAMKKSIATSMQAWRCGDGQNRNLQRRYDTSAYLQGGHKLRIHPGKHHLRYDRCQSLDLQGRGF